MNGRRIYHARGKVLGGSSSINGMIFQRGNPLDYERWAADPGMATWDYAHCLPYFKRMETCLAAAPDDPYRGHCGPLILERGPATNPLFERVLRRRPSRPATTLTDDVNGYRQEGFAPFDRNIRRGRRLSAARAYLHPVHASGRTSRSETRRVRQPDRVRGPPRGRRRVRPRRRPRSRSSGPARSSSCGGAINSPQLLQLSGVGRAAELQPLGIDVVQDLPGRRRAPPGPPRGLHPARADPAGLDAAVGDPEVAPAVDRLPVAVPAARARARRTTSRAAASPAATTTSPTRT